MKLRCLVIDDEPIARKGLEEYVADVPYLQHMGSFENAVEAASYLSKHPIDLIVLDIRMPKLSGIDFLKSLMEPPLVILATAYPDYALESYSLDVIDYLLKPIAFERFLKATQKAFDFQLLKQQGIEKRPDYFFIKVNHQFEKISYADILYIEAMQNYCIVHTPDKKLITYLTLTHMQEKLPANRFMKVHKSYIIALEKIQALDGNILVIGSGRIPISRTFKNDFMNRIMGNNLLKR
ncbi:MAG: LytTR family DNA-binding domain-containing protein [Cyclobacteriaceae bacterium]